VPADPVERVGVEQPGLDGVAQHGVEHGALAGDGGCCGAAAIQPPGECIQRGAQHRWLRQPGDRQ